MRWYDDSSFGWGIRFLGTTEAGKKIVGQIEQREEQFYWDAGRTIKGLAVGERQRAIERAESEMIILLL